MTRLLEEQQALRRELDEERRERRTAEELGASLLHQVERGRRSAKRREERIAALEMESAAGRLAAQEKARHRAQEAARTIELRKRLAGLQVEVDELRFESAWKARSAGAEGHRLRQDLAQVEESLQGSPRWAEADDAGGGLEASDLGVLRELGAKLA